MAENVIPGTATPKPAESQRARQPGGSNRHASLTVDPLDCDLCGMVYNCDGQCQPPMTTPDDLVLNLEDLPTLRKLAKITRAIAETQDSEDSVPPEAGDELFRLCWRYTTRFCERLVSDMENLAATKTILGIPE